MGTGKRFYWMKLKKSFLTSQTVDFLMNFCEKNDKKIAKKIQNCDQKANKKTQKSDSESDKNGAKYVLIYQCLMLLSIDTNGRLCSKVKNIELPFTVEYIRANTKCWFCEETIQTALNLFEQIGILGRDDDGILYLTDYAEMVGSECESTERVKKHRSEKTEKALHCNMNVTQCSVTKSENCNATIGYKTRDFVTTEYRDKSIDILSADADRNARAPAREEFAASSASENSLVDEVVGAYRDTCKSFVQPRVVSTSLKRKIAGLIAVYSVDSIKSAFEIAENSNFLKNKKQGQPVSLDWLMDEDILANLINGKYSDDDRATDNGDSIAGYGDGDKFFESAVAAGMKEVF